MARFQEFPSVRHVGIISDTHGLLRDGAVDALRGVDIILHAGDVGRRGVIEALREIAPVFAVRGNVDREAWAEELPARQWLLLGATRVLMIHDLKDLSVEAVAQHGVSVVVSGHTHRPFVERRDGVLYVNPGSAGRRRFRFPVSVARLEVGGEEAHGEIMELYV